jgi:zinc resistance-associated protein
MLNARADALTQRAAGLKKLADAWQPLYQTLDATQKQRMRILLVAFHHEMKDAVESRMEIEEEVED